jgi:histidinol-phosphatase (PHP family)
MTDMARASYARGVRALCFTDHVDLDFHGTGLPDPDCFNCRAAMLEMFQTARRETPADLRLALGIELGEGNHDVERFCEISSSPELDFVLGSLHNIRGTIDFYDLRYTSLSEVETLAERYLDELIELSNLPYFDVMAHIGYIARYIRRDGFRDFAVTMDNYGDKLDIILKNLISHGRGVELNCSGLRRNPPEETLPGADIVRRYRQLGGEIITLGSDAHKTAHAGLHLAEGAELLRGAGFKYVTIYQKRKPEFIPLSKLD